MRSAWFKNPCHPKTYLSSKFRRIIRENRRNEPRQILGSVFLIFIVFIIFYRFSLKNSEILCYVNLDPQKKEISYCGDFSFELFFQEVDKEHVGFVDFQNLNEFFKTNMYYPYEEEIISILRRMDKNDDGRLASSELQVGFKPLSPKEFKTNNLKSLYSTPLEKNSASKNITSASKNVKNSSINYQSSNKKATNANNGNNSQEFKTGSIYRSPISSKKNAEENSDSYSKITTKYEKYDTSANKTANISNIPQSQSIVNNANETTKSPANYSYYPYEPVRRAFSPMKEQIMKSSNLEANSPVKLLKNTVSLEKSQASLVEKYSSYGRGKYNNEYRSPNVNNLNNFARNEESGRKLENSNKGEIIGYFKKLVNFEGDIEKNKQDLFFRPDFNMFDLYMVFDKEKKGYCFLNDFEQGFKLMNVNISSREATLFFKKFEKNNCGRLRLAEFSKIFAPILLEGQPQSERRSINNEGQFDYFEVNLKKKKN